MTTPAQHDDNLPDPITDHTFEQTCFRPPKRPNGGTAHVLPADTTGELR